MLGKKILLSVATAATIWTQGLNATVVEDNMDSKFCSDNTIRTTYVIIDTDGIEDKQLKGKLKKLYAAAIPHEPYLFYIKKDGQLIKVQEAGCYPNLTLSEKKKAALEESGIFGVKVDKLLERRQAAFRNSISSMIKTKVVPAYKTTTSEKNLVQQISSSDIFNEPNSRVVIFSDLSQDFNGRSIVETDVNSALKYVKDNYPLKTQQSDVHIVYPNNVSDLSIKKEFFKKYFMESNADIHISNTFKGEVIDKLEKIDFYVELATPKKPIANISLLISKKGEQYSLSNSRLEFAGKDISIPIVKAKVTKNEEGLFKIIAHLDKNFVSKLFVTEGNNEFKIKLTQDPMTKLFFGKLWSYDGYTKDGKQLDITLNAFEE